MKGIFDGVLVAPSNIVAVKIAHHYGWMLYVHNGIRISSRRWRFIYFNNFSFTDFILVEDIVAPRCVFILETL